MNVITHEIGKEFAIGIIVSITEYKRNVFLLAIESKAGKSAFEMDAVELANFAVELGIPNETEFELVDLVGKEVCIKIIETQSTQSRAYLYNQNKKNIN
jgi:hypothetical protein